MEEGSSDREVDQCTARGTDASTGTARSRRMISHPARKKFKPHALASSVSTSRTSCGGADFLTSRVLTPRSRSSASASQLSIRDISNKLCDTDAGRPQRRHANHETAPHRSVLISDLGRQRNPGTAGTASRGCAVLPSRTGSGLTARSVELCGRPDEGPDAYLPTRLGQPRRIRNGSVNLSCL